jgi:hypothetical protein
MSSSVRAEVSGPDGDEPYTLFVNQTEYSNARFLRTKVLVVSGGANSAPAAAITEISWNGLRCNLEVNGGTAGMTADLRREAAGGPSVATTAKPVDDGGARLLVEDDELEGAVVVVVLLSPDGRVIAQRRTRVGGDQ